MQTNNRSGLQCLEHPREEITNYCIKTLKPLCPDCVQIHSKNVDNQDILSWKHCVNKNLFTAKNSLDELKAIYDIQRQSKGFKSIEAIQSQNLQKLYNLRDKYHRLIDQAFNTHQRNLRNQIRSQYKISQNDTSKLKAAIQEMQKLIIKMTNMSTVLGALKKCMLLDHRSLVDFFADLKHPTSKTVTERFFSQSSGSFNEIKASIDRCITLQNFNMEHEHNNQKRYQSPQVNKPYPSNSGGQQNDPFKPIKIYNKEYFKSDCRNKLLHFFIPCSTQLKILRVEDAQKGEWRSIKFKANKELPYYFKSVITSNGEIYLTGGSQEQQRSKEIYRYNFQKNVLEYVGDMIYERSSHSICYVNECIYIIGGFTQAEGQVTRHCQVFNLQTMKSSQIAPLNTPSANSCATSFKDQYIFKFGGIFNKLQGNSLIEMYSIKNNRWIVVSIDTPKNIPHLELLSFSAAIQYNQSEIMVFGGYDNSESERPERLCYSLAVMIDKNVVQVKNYNTTPLPYAQAFWDNNPILYRQKIYALQNITDEQDELTALADERRIIIFNGDRWL